MTFEEMQSTVLELKRKIDIQIDEDIKYRRMLEDMLANLTLENMPEVSKTISDVNDGVFVIEEKICDTENEVARLKQSVGTVENGMSIIDQKVDGQGAMLSLVVSKGEDGSDSVNCASIIGAINSSGSSLKLSADKIQFEGSNITIDTGVLKVNSDGCVNFSSPVKTKALHTSEVTVSGRVDFGNDNGLSGYVYINSGEGDTLELTGEGGVIINTMSENGDGNADSNVYIFAPNLYVNGSRVMTFSSSDIALLKTLLAM